LKVILKEYQEKLGEVGDIIEVKAGYANNYLIPNGIALLATQGNINQMELVKKAALKVEAKNIEDANKIAQTMANLVLNYVVKTGEEGKLYGSITNKDLAEKIVEDKNVEVDRKKIDLPEHIKELGEYDVDIKLYKEIKTGIKVIVEPDEESRALIEAHKKEKEEVLKEEKEKLDEEIQTESEKKDVKKEDKEAKPEETSEKDYKKKKQPEEGKDQ